MLTSQLERQHDRRDYSPHLFMTTLLFRDDCLKYRIILTPIKNNSSARRRLLLEPKLHTCEVLVQGRDVDVCVSGTMHTKTCALGHCFPVFASWDSAQVA